MKRRLLKTRPVKFLRAGKSAYLCAAVILLCICTLLSAQDSSPAITSSTTTKGGTIHGMVKSGNMPIPGVAVSAVNPQTRQRSAVTWTDLDGSYSLQVPEDGDYFVRTQMAAFAPAFARVTIGPANRNAKADLEMMLMSRAQAEGLDPRQQLMQQMGGGQGGRGGYQSLSVMQGEGGTDSSTSSTDDQAAASSNMPSLSNAAGTATESVAVSGSTENSALAGMSNEELQQRIQDFREQQGPGFVGGFGGGGGGGFFGGPGFGGGGFGGGGFGGFGGGRGRFNINRPHGSLYYSMGDSIFNAAPYSLSGQPSTKPNYFQNRFGGNVGGPLNIPKIYKGGDRTFYFINYTGNQSQNPFDQFATVPTLAERNGDFSNTTIASRSGAALPVQIFDPTSQTPFANNIIPTNRINSAAAGLLAFIPLPNLPGEVQNFHRVTSYTNSNNDVSIRINHVLGPPPTQRRTTTNRNGPGGRGGRRGGRNSINIGLGYSNRDNALVSIFPGIGGHTTTRGINASAGYTQSLGRINNVLRFNFNQNRTTTHNLYAFSKNIAGNLGINGVSQNPFDWGVPGISLTNFAGLSDIRPALRRDQTSSLSDFMIWNHGKHTLRWGGDFRWAQTNTQTDSNARGSFTFTGLNTAQQISTPRGLAASPGTGFDFADFLLGLPQQTSAQFGTNKYQFRGNSWDLFIQDEFRATGNLSFNLGLRYEYVSPYTELNNQIVNLVFNPGLTTVLPVVAGHPGLPNSLIRPDRNNFAPRVGIAWKAAPHTVVRAGYGINYNTGAYASMIQQLAFQPPFSFTQTNIESATTPLTLQNGFFTPQPGLVTNNYAVDPNYRLGYVQIWNMNVQQEITSTIIVNFDYTGTKGTRLDIVEAPNRISTASLLNPNVQPFNWETSEGDSTANAGSVRVRKRLQHGISIGGTYTFSKAMDNASSIGGGGTVVAQDPNNLAAERGLSSFDQRHRFSADYMWELPFGHDKHWLNQDGIMRAVFGDWQWSGDWSIASGTPFTPRVVGNFQDVSRGTNGTLRANVTGQSVSLSNPTVLEWFNTAAFVSPPSGQFGDARRNSIEGPGSISFNMSLAKTIPMRESRVLEFRAQASNVFNKPQFTSINTNVGTLTYGQVTGVGSMRTMQLLARFRF